MDIRLSCGPGACNMSERYVFDSADKDLLSSAIRLLKKVAASDSTKPAQMVTVAKLAHVLSVLPRVTTGVTASVSVSCPRNRFGDIVTHHWYDVAVEDGQLQLSASGHFYRPSTGGDTFTTMMWCAIPEEPAQWEDNLESLGIVPDVRSFPEGVECIDLAEDGYTVRAIDNDNPLLEVVFDEEDEDTPDVDDVPSSDEYGETPDTKVTTNWSIRPVDAADEQLAALVDAERIDATEPVYANGATNCDRCRCPLNSRGLYVDGRLRGDLIWSNMCARCFADVGEGIGWGSGQLYARQPDRRWRLVAGGQPPGEAAEMDSEVQYWVDRILSPGPASDG